MQGTDKKTTQQMQQRKRRKRLMDRFKHENDNNKTKN